MCEKCNNSGSVMGVNEYGEMTFTFCDCEHGQREARAQRSSTSYGGEDA